MQQNLRVTKLNDGIPIEQVIDSIVWKQPKPRYCWAQPGDTKSNAKFGALYNWHSVNTGKLCPIGWHVPSDVEWIALGNYLITMATTLRRVDPISAKL
jgi:uncharacterized protein (TIGR02145 family)